MDTVTKEYNSTTLIKEITLMVSNVQTGAQATSATAGQAAEAKVIQAVDINQVRFGTLMQFEGTIQNADNDQGGNARVWVAPYLDTATVYLDAEGNEITAPSTIPVYLRGNVDPHQFMAENPGLKTFYVTRGQINARYDIVYDNELPGLVQRQYGGNRAAILHLPLRQKPDSSQGMTEDELRTRAAQDRALNTNIVRGARSLGLTGQALVGAAIGAKKAVGGAMKDLSSLFDGF